MNQEDKIKDLYKDTFSKITATSSLKDKVLNANKASFRKPLSVAARISAAAAVLIACLAVSNIVTWAASGQPWIVSVSQSLFDEKRQEYSSYYESLDISEETDAPVSSNDGATEQESVKVYPEGEYSESYLDALHEHYDEALSEGFVYQFNKILTYDSDYGVPVHSYEFIKEFTAEELSGAEFNPDYSWIKIQGENYYVQWSYPGAYEEIDASLPFDENGNYTGNNPAGIAATDQARDESNPWSGTTFILRVFSEENWNDFADIITVEVLEGVKETLARPIYEGRVAVYSNEDDSIVRTFTAEEYINAEISENFQIVRIAGEYYMATYASEDNFLTISEIKLRPLSGYDGDASTENPDQMKYYTLKDFGL